MTQTATNVGRRLGKDGPLVSPVAFGAWPIAGMTSPGVTDADSLSTLAAALDAGVNFIDTAFCYGPHGESERLIAQAIRGRRHEVVLATKGGLHWVDGKQTKDASPTRLQWECEESLRRLQVDAVDLLYLHAPDPAIPIEDSAGALLEIKTAGKTKAIGVSNVSLDELARFHAVCPLSAFQPPYNMLDRSIEADRLPWCVERGIAVVVYWPLVKGLLAGKLAADHQFASTDSRRKYPMFHGEEWRRNLDLVEQLRGIAQRIGRTVSQLVINWTIHQPGITAALCGAKRPDQILENAGAMGWKLDGETLALVEKALLARGVAAAKSPV